MANTSSGLFDVFQISLIALDLIILVSSLWFFSILKKLGKLPPELDVRSKNIELQKEIRRRELAEKELLNLNSKLENLVTIRTLENEAIVESSPLAIMKINAQREVMTWNFAAEKLFGWKKEEIIGKPNPLIPEDKKTEHDEILRNTLNGVTMDPIETHRLKKDGSLVDVCVWNAPSWGPETGKTVIAIFDNITERLKRRRALAESKRIAEQKNISKSLFLANTGHEIRTPLNAILGFSDILMTEKVDEKSMKEFVKTISKNARSLKILIDDLLDISKIEAGQLTIKNQDTNLPEIFKEICATLSPKAAERNVDLSCRGLENLPRVVSVDPLRLRQIILNLVNNALKFTDSGHVHMIPKVQNSRLIIEIEDTGRGMTPEEIQKIFKPFAQANDNISYKYGGTGLGLFISKSLARQMGGTVYIKSSEKGKGTTFVIEVRVDPAQVELPELEPQKESSTWELKDKRVLVVDDVPENRFLVSRFMGSAGSFVESADNGFEVRSKVQNFHPDIILLDIQMPGKDGYEVIHELRNSGFRNPVIAMTAHSMREDIDRCLREGFNSHISKPITKAELINQVADCLVHASTA